MDTAEELKNLRLMRGAQVFFGLFSVLLLLLLLLVVGVCESILGNG